MKPTTVSLFCGAGGESAGKELAFKDLGIDIRDWTSLALNHWDLAVATHGANFPTIHCYQEDITQVTAATFGVTKADLLWASPSCVHHSRARGGKPMNDQQRSHADEVVERWLKMADVRVLLMENVPEFIDWGPLYTTHSGGCPGGAKCLKACHFDKPIPERKGEFFRRFLANLKALGYRCEHRVLCAADYGDPTTRRRFFMQAVKDGLPIVWADPTHRDPKKGADMFTGHLPLWRTAAGCIDWSIPCPSIFDRKRPLKPATCRRIAAGVQRYVLDSQEPFLVNLTHGGRLEELGEPFKTITTANRGEKALLVPSLLNLSHGGRNESLDEPLKTITAEPKGGDRAIIIPSLVGVGGRAGQSRPRGVDEPFGTCTAKADGALVAASMISLRGTRPGGLAGTAMSVEEPVRTISAGGEHAALCAAFLAKHYGGPAGHQTPGSSLDSPMGTVTSQDHHGLVAVNLMTNTSGHGPTSADQPVPTITTGNHHALVASFLTKYHATGGQWQGLESPLHAVTTKDEFGLITVEIDGETYIVVDIGMRMLQPHELSKAMGFPEGFLFVDEDGKPLSKANQVRMIGNACPVNTVAALIKAVVLQRPLAFGMPQEVVA